METNGYQDVASDLAVAGDPRIAVIGVGGAGCRIASMLYGSGSRARILAINTDRAALEQTQADVRLFICKEVTKGQGARGDTVLGRKCAQIHSDEIMAAVKGSDIAIIVAGMGGGTGTGAASVVSELCDRVGVKTAAIAVMPFTFEGTDRQQTAAEGYRALHVVCKNLLRIENDRVLSEPLRSMNEAMETVNRSIVEAVQNEIDDAYKAVRESITRKLAKLRDGGETEDAKVSVDAPQVLGF